MLTATLFYLCNRRKPFSRSLGLHDPLLDHPSSHKRERGFGGSAYRSPSSAGPSRLGQAGTVTDWEQAIQGAGRGLDRAAQHALDAAESKLRRTTPMGTPVGQTPAGNYVGLYYQYGRTHPIPAQSLACTASSADGTTGAVDGRGFDDVGQFHVSGTFSGAKLALRKQYIPGTGDARENLGHAVELRLTLCDMHAVLPERSHELSRYGAPPGTVAFYGTWHVRTRNYKGDAEMVLWLPPVPVVVGHMIQPGTGVGPVVGGTVVNAVPVA